MSSSAPGRIQALSQVGLQLPIDPVPGAIDKAAERGGDEFLCFFPRDLPFVHRAGSDTSSFSSVGSAC